MTTASAHGARPHLLRPLGEVERGETITITRHGVPIAQLVPVLARRQTDIEAAIAGIIERRRNITLGDDIPIRELIEEGRM